MPTVASETDNTVVTSQALDLLDSFEGGLGDVVQEIAEHYARVRTGNTINLLSPVEITVPDVRRAAEQVVAALEKMAQEGQMPGELMDRVSKMTNCLHCEDQ